jgi:hypothetical protein
LRRACGGSLALSLFLLLHLLVISPQLRVDVWRGGCGGGCRLGTGGASHSSIAVSLLPLLLQLRQLSLLGWQKRAGTPRLPRTGQQTGGSLLLLAELLKARNIRVL